jgi:hypothetical protein
MTAKIEERLKRYIKLSHSESMPEYDLGKTNNPIKHLENRPTEKEKNWFRRI